MNSSNQRIIAAPSPLPAPTSLCLVAGRSPDEMLQIMRTSIVQQGRCNRILCFHLHDMKRRGEYQTFGCSSTIQFAETFLELGRSLACDLIATGRALLELEKIDAAYRTGEISWTKARLLGRIAVPETEDAWLARAKKLNCKQLEREVGRSEKGRPPRPDGKGLPEVRFRTQLDLDAVTHETWEMTKKRFRLEAGEQISECDVLRFLCQAMLKGETAGPVAAGSFDPSLFRLVVDHRPSDGTASLRTGDGPVPLTEEQMAQILKLNPPSIELGEPGPEEMILPVGKDNKISPALRQYICFRDGWCCQNCNSKDGLHAHHIIFRSRGGRTHPDNLVLLCSVCHSLVHEGLLVIEGRAPFDLNFKTAQGRDLSVPEDLTLQPEQHLTLDPIARKRHAEDLSQPETTFESMPLRANGDWWQRHRHLFEWKERKGTLEYHAGPALTLPHVEETSGSPRPPDTRSSNRHRPPNLDDIIGQRRVVKSLKVAVAAARKRDRPVRHVLLQGPPGLGKTTLAQAVAREMGTRAWTASGVAVTDPSSLASLLLELGAGDVLFLDEIHALPRKVAEMLYEALEDRQLSLVITCGARTRTLTLDLRPFTLIGATTDPERIPPPLLARFGLQEDMDRYDAPDLVRIVERAAKEEQFKIAEPASHIIARASLGTPRTALRILGRAVDIGVSRARDIIDESDAIRCLEAAGLDHQGLGPVHQRVLGNLRDREGPIGTARLAALVGVSRATFRAMYEPDLLRLHLVAATPRGLVIAGTGPAARQALPCACHHAEPSG